MTAWQEQPPAIRATLNPLLVAGVLAWTSNGYRDAVNTAMPWPLAFVTPALVLHTPSRQALPGAASKRLLTWRDENDILVAELPARCAALQPFIRAGLRAGLRHRLMVLDGTGIRSLLPRSRPPPTELREIARAAALVGRWLAPLPVPAVLAQLGVAP